MPTHLCFHTLLTSFIPEVQILEGFKEMLPKTSLNKNISRSADIAWPAGFIDFLLLNFVSGDNRKVTFTAKELQN
jgi:hypothetical protein